MTRDIALSPRSKLVYGRVGTDEHAHFHIHLSGALANHELRCILIGVWLTLNDDDRAEHIEELRTYFTQADSYPPGISAVIANALGHPWKPPSGAGRG